MFQWDPNSWGPGTVGQTLVVWLVETLNCPFADGKVCWPDLPSQLTGQQTQNHPPITPITLMPALNTATRHQHNASVEDSKCLSLSWTKIHRGWFVRAEKWSGTLLILLLPRTLSSLMKQLLGHLIFFVSLPRDHQHQILYGPNVS